MRKVKIAADLTITNQSNSVVIYNQENELIVALTTKSAANLPIKYLWQAKKHLNKSAYVSQPIVVLYNSEKLFVIFDGKYKVKSYGLLLKIIFSSLFKL